MAVNLSPVFQDAQLDSNGNPASGFLLYTYVAGSTTEQTTYQDSAGNTAHANPIVLNSRGEPSAPIWLTAGQAYKFILKTSAGVTVRTIDNVDGINDTTVTLDQWTSSGLTATYVSATQFTVPGDQTTALHVGRRVKVTDAGGTKYGYITASAYTTLTTVTVSLDSGSLEDPISNLNISIQTTDNPSDALLTDAHPIRSGSSDKTKKLRVELDGITTATTRVATMPDYNVMLGNMPAGIVMDYAGSSVPTGWLECDGSAVSRTTYADLFTAISTTWGTGDGSTTFNLPDFRGRARIGKGTGTATESGVNADVDTTADTLTVASNNTKWITGMPVTFTLASGTITGLTSGATYYVIRASSTTIKLASSLANAQGGTAIDLTAKSSPVWTITYSMTARTLAEGGGEEGHAQSSTELYRHQHTGEGLTAGAGSQGPGAGSVDFASMSFEGGNAAMNVMQPYAVTMAIIKY